MTCPRCQAPARAGSRFCEDCGAPLQRAESGGDAAPTGAAGASLAEASAPPGAALAGPIAGFTPTPVVPRVEWTPWTDPTEGAFGTVIPRGWQVNGGIQRDPATGLPRTVFHLRADASGQVGFVLVPETHQFSDPAAFGASMMGAFTGMMGDMSMWMANAAPQPQPLQYQPIPNLLQAFFLPSWRRSWPDVVLLQVEQKPELTHLHLQELSRECLKRNMQVQVDGAVADVMIGYTWRGVPMLHVGRISTSRPAGGLPVWFAEVSVAWFAPRDQFESLQPIFRRVFESVQFNPQWQQMQLASDNARTALTQADIHRRQMQISQTLSQTSDIVAGAYWSKELIHNEHAQARAGHQAQDDWQHRYSNATLGWEDRLDDNGRRYTIEAGHERVWRDDAGNFHYGGQGTNPDPRWHELKPPGA